MLGQDGIHTTHDNIQMYSKTVNLQFYALFWGSSTDDKILHRSKQLD